MVVVGRGGDERERERERESGRKEFRSMFYSEK